jgi:hypothetical protein
MAAALASEAQSIFDILNLWSVFRQGAPPPNESRRYYTCTPRTEATVEKPSYKCTQVSPPLPLKESGAERTVVVKALWPQAIDPMFLSYELSAPAMIQGRSAE